MDKQEDMMLTKIIPGVLCVSFLFAASYSFDWSNWIQALCAVYAGGTIFVVCFGMIHSNQLLLTRRGR